VCGTINKGEFCNVVGCGHKEYLSVKSIRHMKCPQTAHVLKAWLALLDFQKVTGS
jgi:hypothetical protein